MARTRKLPNKTKPKGENTGSLKRGERITKPITRSGRIVAKPFKVAAKPLKAKPFRVIGNILYKIFFISYFKESWRELRQVVWPGRRETAKLTLAVFIFAFSFGLLITIVDYGLDKLFKEVLL